MKSNDQVMQEKFMELLAAAGVTDSKELAADMMAAVVKLAKDQPGRGEMKLMARTLKELRYAFKIFKPYRGRRKVSIFGSARTLPDHPNYQSAVRFAEMAAESGFMVITGAGGGIMAAGHEGAGKAHSFGVAIRLPFEQATNDIIANDEKLIHFRYFFSRKLVFVKETHAIVLYPGGFGTHDEGFEVLTLVQTGRCDPMPIVLLEQPGGDYWKGWEQFIKKQLMATGLISNEDSALYFITQDPQEALEHIKRFYRNYQSLRYVHHEIVLRIKHAPTAQELERLQGDFQDIVAAGKIELKTAAEVESDTDIMPDSPRLAFVFDRRSLARLRLLIDRLNGLASLPAEVGPEAAQVGASKESDRGIGEIASEEGIKVV